MCILLTWSLSFSLYKAREYYRDLYLIDQALTQVLANPDGLQQNTMHFAVRREQIDQRRRVTIVFKQMHKQVLNDAAVRLDFMGKAFTSCSTQGLDRPLPDYYLPQECRRNKNTTLPHLVFMAIQ